MTQSLRLLLSALVVVASLALAGCGFHLRNQTDIPYTSIYIDSGNGSAVAAALRRLMTAGGHADRLASSPA
ncbi:MAG: hypothetical protein M0T86_00265, partial [Betaproteobacteria bacterium]|nr:hypothetical protein [Betaproteobacteria bacterium]